MGWLGAVQSQEYANAKWSLGQRLPDARDAAIEQAFAAGRILRTHVMRPTWHFVTPADIRWLLKLTAPRVKVALGYYTRRLELDDAVLGRANDVLAGALAGGRQLTRAELVAALRQAGLVSASDSGQRVGHILTNAELDAVICSGALRGKQHTYALLDERVPPARMLERDEALAELAGRYFASHGPATVKDFSWWSGLTAIDARAGVDMAGAKLAREVIDGKTYWFPSNAPAAPERGSLVHLLPAFDEYVIAYKDRSDIIDPHHLAQAIAGNGIIIAFDGRIAGTWKRTFAKGSVVVTPRSFNALTEEEEQALVAAVRRYGEFLGLSVVPG